MEEKIKTTPEKVESKIIEESKLETKVENKKPVKKVTPKKKEEKIIKEKAIANAYSLRISPKQSKYVCRMIRRKTPERAMELLENVVKGKQPVKMTGLEVGHQKGKGIAGARFPKNAAQGILEIVKQLLANSITNGIEDPIITIAMPNKASLPTRSGGRKGKRTHLHLEAQSRAKLLKNKK